MILARNLIYKKLVFKLRHCQMISSYDRISASGQLLSLVMFRKCYSKPHSWTYSKCLRFYSTQQHLVYDLIQGIDTEEIKEQCRRHQLMTGNVISPEDIAQKQLNIQFEQAVRGLPKKLQQKLRIIQQEHSILFSEGYNIPSPKQMNNEMWLTAVTFGTLQERFEYYLGINSHTDRRDSLVSVETQEAVSSNEDDGDSKSIFYDYNNPDIETRWANHRLASAMQFGQPLVIDMDFADIHTAAEIAFVTQQLWEMYCINRADPMPFHLIFTSCNSSNQIYRQLCLHHLIKTPFVLATFTEKHYKDLFPTHDLVYLSAQAYKRIGELNPNIAYIIGAYYDPCVRKKASFVKAGQHKIKCLQFPLTQHVWWQHQTSKDLDLSHVISLLLAVKAKTSWRDAILSHFPTLKRKPC